VEPEYASHSFNKKNMMELIHQAEKLGVNYILKPAKDSMGFLKPGHNYLFLIDSTGEGEIIEAVKINKFPPYRVMVKTDSKLTELAGNLSLNKP